MLPSCSEASALIAPQEYSHACYASNAVGDGIRARTVLHEEVIAEEDIIDGSYRRASRML